MRTLTPPVSPENRDRTIERLASESWDLLVVGAGISGLAVARDAALRGLRVALVEAHDVAFGTSSRSSRLIHGGLRYLASMEMSLVREGLVERRLLLRTAPHLVRAERFVYLVYCEDPAPLWKIRLGVSLYGLLAIGNRLGRSRKLSQAELRQLLPGIETDCLDGAVSYHDGATHDARLTVAIASSAQEAGVPIVTRCPVIELLSSSGRTTGALIRDGITGQQREVAARAVVLCTGPWQELHADVPPRIRTARGTHISVPAEKLPIRCFVAMRSPEDGRQTFALPFGGYTVIGTTDTDDPCPPGDVRPTTQDTDYLLEVANHVFRMEPLRRGDVVGAWAGLRPLVADEAARDPDALSRRHQVVEAEPGRWILAGGKLTSHRRMAEDCVDKIVSRESFGDRKIRSCSTDKTPLFPADTGAGREALQRLKVPPETIDHLLGLYGARIGRLNAHLLEAPPVELSERLVIAQARLAASEEGALSLDDVLLRRLHPGPLDLVRCWRQAPLVAKEIADPLGWTRDQMDQQIAAFRRGLEAELRATRGGLPLERI